MAQAPLRKLKKKYDDTLAGLRRIATLQWCFQNHALYPHMTVFENMLSGLRLKKVRTGGRIKLVADLKSYAPDRRWERKGALNGTINEC